MILAEKPCRFECGKILIYDPNLRSPPFKEVNTDIHHTFKRCAEVQGSKQASERFKAWKDKKK